MKARLIWTGAMLLLGAALWLPVTSLALCVMLKTLWQNDPWVVPVAAFYYWRDFGNDPVVANLLRLCAAGAGVVALLPAFCALCWPESRRMRPARPGEQAPAPKRALSDAHGAADWMTIKAARKLFPGPHPAYGGIVVGEAYRVDQDKVAGVRFDPDNRATWGQGGKAPLLIDPCTSDATHGAVFAGSGGYKTTAVAIPTLAYWTGSVVVLDPSCQLGPMTAHMRKDMGHKVVMIGPGLQGFNPLDWIDIKKPLAEAHVQMVVDWLSGDQEGSGSAGQRDDQSDVFRTRGKELIKCLLADILWSDRSESEKTLRTLRRRLATPEKKMKGLLAEIHLESNSPLARELAGTLMDVFHETFSGMYSNAVSTTEWLSISVYANMVSGSSFRTEELRGGKLTAFVQIQMESLRATPALARVVVGALLNGIYQAEGAITGRALFLLDEVNFLGRMKALEDARDAGRKYGITLLCMWQSLGQLTNTWGKEGKGSWFNSCSWRLFAVVDDEGTAEEVSRTAGKYTVLARTQGQSSSRQSGSNSGSSNRGRNEGLSEQPRELIKPDEVRTRMRADEAIIFRRGAPPLRCGRPIFFRRPDLKARVEADRYRTAAE